MAVRLTAHYQPGASFLHHLDARCKLFGYLVLCVAVLNMDAALLLLFTLLGACWWRLGLASWGDLKAQGGGWAALLTMLFLFQVVADPRNIQSGYPWLYPRQGPVLEAGVRCWRMGLVLGYGALLNLVTRPRQIQDAVAWCLMPIPGLPARRIGLMVGLMMRFLASLGDMLEEIQLATRARLGDRGRRPGRRARFMVLPLFRKALIRCQEVAWALAARGYHDNVPLNLAPIPGSHLAALSLWLLAVALAVWISGRGTT